jgi:hypothetical protein
MAKKLLEKTRKMVRKLSKWRNSNSCYVVMKSLAKLLFVVIWKIESLCNELVELSKMISGTKAENVGWFLLPAYD